MARVPRPLHLVPLVLLTGCMGWCDLDPFGLTERRVAGGYRLKAWEDGTFWLLTPGDTSTSQAYSLQVARLGWDRSRVVAQLEANPPATSGGWFVFDAATGRTAGPLSAAALAADPIAGRIPTFRPDSAWERLGSRAPGA